MLTIKEFVSSSLLQIAEGLDDALKQSGEKNIALKVSPHHDAGSTVSRTPTLVSFDLAVSAVNSDIEGGKTVAGIGIVSAVFNVGARNVESESIKSETSSVSRIRFALDVYFPGTYDGPYRPGKVINDLDDDHYR